MQVLDVLDRLGIPYMIMGGFAVRIWGIPRPTDDADLAIGVDDDALRNLLQVLSREGFLVPEEHEKGWVDSVGDLKKVKASQFEGTSLWDVNLFLVCGRFLEAALSRRLSVRFDGREAWFVAPEDLILLKLIAHRSKDQLDVEEILTVTSNLDMHHLRTWAAKLKVLDRLEGYLGSR
jgi:hypothetical protein